MTGSWATGRYGMLPAPSESDVTREERRAYEVSRLRISAVARIMDRLAGTGVTITDLARVTGLHEPWLAAVLDAAVPPSLDDLAEISHALGMRWELTLGELTLGELTPEATPGELTPGATRTQADGSQ